MWKILKWILFSCPLVEYQQGKDEDQRTFNNSVQPEIVKPKLLKDAFGAKAEIVLDGSCRCIGLCCCVHEGKTSIVFN
jgi:hypothetical protein